MSANDIMHISSNKISDVLAQSPTALSDVHHVKQSTFKTCMIAHEEDEGEHTLMGTGFLFLLHVSCTKGKMHV